MNSLAALPVLLAPMLAWAGMGEDAEYAAGRILLEEKVLNVYLAGSDEGRLTILFGKQVADWQIDAVLARLNKEPAIRGVAHSRVETDYCPFR